MGKSNLIRQSEKEFLDLIERAEKVGGELRLIKLRSGTRIIIYKTKKKNGRRK